MRTLILGGALAALLALGLPAVAADPAVTPESGLEAPAGKRVGPPEVAPVLIEGLRIETLPWGQERGLGQNGGYIAAFDPASGQELWTLKVYEVVYDAALESDVQDVFIEEMAAVDGKLLITDENGVRYLVDVATQTVAPE